MGLVVHPEPLLSERTTLGLGGRALAEAVASDRADLDELGAFFERHGGRPFVLGRGSNVLARDNGLDLVLVRAADTTGPERIGQDQDRVLVKVGAGAALPGLLGWLRRAGLSGLEGLAGVPGSVGGAVAMNAGAYGQDLSQVLSRVRLWTPDRGLFWRPAADCAMGYRQFDPLAGPGPWLVWEVELSLAPGEPEAVAQAMRRALDNKRRTQPLDAKSAGCVFKNPAGRSAGRLLDEAGFKGRRLGDMAFSELHANFLVNLGKGTAAQALELLDQARAEILKRHGIDLETEVILL
ncbi:MAG: UDP-N-acetylmuramate dehydrogenase [Desulfovibrionaceae bacterium]|nr:UDP-N-acetylmuramate dehydrogenase [Desulfovibrionaceae bacterium]